MELHVLHGRKYHRHWGGECWGERAFTDGRYLAAHGLRRNQLAGVVSLDGSAFDIPDRIKNGSPKIAENCRLAFGEREEVQADGSPINHIEGEVPLPPFLLIYLKEGSLNHTQSKQFAERVERSAGKAELVQISDATSHQALCDDLGTKADHAGSILIEFLKAVTR